MQIYHNHIPRTGGNYVRDSLMKKLTAIKGVNLYVRDPLYFFCQLHKNQIEHANLVSGHFGLEPEIIMGEDVFLSVTTLRDPVMRLVSHFQANIETFKSLLSFNPNGNATALAMFQRWIRTDKDMMSKSNLQARFLTNGLNHNITDVPVNADLIFLQKRDGWGIGTEEPTYEKALAKINSMFCVGTTEKMNEFLTRFDQNFKNKFGIDLLKTDFPVDTYMREGSLSLYNSLTAEDVQIIKDLNQIDMQLWEYVTNSYANG